MLRLRNGSVYIRIFDLLAREGQALAISDVYERSGATITHLRKLAALDFIRLRSEEVWRDPLADRDFVTSTAPELTADQTRVWAAIARIMVSGRRSVKPILVHGVTGSGKTEIYMHAVELALQRGQQAIVLVPEIALTPQSVRRFSSRFPGRVALCTAD